MSRLFAKSFLTLGLIYLWVTFLVAIGFDIYTFIFAGVFGIAFAAIFGIYSYIKERSKEKNA